MSSRVLVLEPLALERGEAAQLHVEDGLGLALAEVEGRLLQAVARRFGRGRLADGAMTASRLSMRLEQALEDVRAVLRLLEVELAAAADDLAAVVDEELEGRLEADRARLAVDQGQHVHGEGGLHRRVLVEGVEDGARPGRRASAR